MILYLILLSSGFVLFCFILFMLVFYDWRSVPNRRKCQKIPHPEMNFIAGIGFEVVKYPIDEVLDFIIQVWKNTGNVFYYHILGYTNVMLVNPEDIEVLFSNMKYITKGVEYDLVRPWLGNGLLTSTGDHWHMRRKQLTPSFHFKILENYLPVFNQNANILLEKLTETGTQPIAISPLISSCTLNIICETTMGTSLNLFTKDAKEYADAVKEVSVITTVRGMTFWLNTNWIFRLSPMGRRYYKLIGKIHSFVDHVIEERRQIACGKIVDDEEKSVQIGKGGGLYKQRKSFLDHLLSIQKENPDLLSDNDIRDEVNTFMFEGHDTIAAAITWTLFMLANYPEIQDRVHNELNAIFPVDEDSYQHATVEDLNKLHYLEMVLKESLRLFPSVPYVSRTIPHDLQIVTGQYLIPAETNVVVMTYLVHRNPDIFEDPEKFDPERFTSERAKSYHPYAYLPFSAGYRNCIGQRFAMTEAKVLLSTILRKFRVSSIQKREDIKVNPAVVLRPSPEINLSFTPL